MCRQGPEVLFASGRRAHDARVAAILRLLRDRAEQVPELEEISRRLSESEDRETRGFAAEILIRRGAEPAVEAEGRGVFVEQQSGIAFVAIPAGKYPGDPEFESYRKAWKQVNDRWLKTTLAAHAPDGPSISFEEVDTSVLPPEEPRDYR